MTTRSDGVRRMAAGIDRVNTAQVGITVKTNQQSSFHGVPLNAGWVCPPCRANKKPVTIARNGFICKQPKG